MNPFHKCFFFFHLILTYMVCYVCHVVWPCGFQVKVLLTINRSILCSSRVGGVACSSHLSPPFLSPLDCQGTNTLTQL